LQGLRLRGGFPLLVPRRAAEDARQVVRDRAYSTGKRRKDLVDQRFVPGHHPGQDLLDQRLALAGERREERNGEAWKAMRRVGRRCQDLVEVESRCQSRERFLAREEGEGRCHAAAPCVRLGRHVEEPDQRRYGAHAVCGDHREGCPGHVRTTGRRSSGRAVCEDKP
jgi:hypothetical protein